MDITGRLERWRPFGFGSLYGYIFDDIHKRFEDGQDIHTSQVLTPEEEWKEGAVVETLNSKYLLGKKYVAPAKRDCVQVITEILKEVPKTETELIKDLEWNNEDASYKAPEETLQWQRTMQTLQRHIPIPKEDWEYKVISIFTNTDETILRTQFKNKQDGKPIIIGE